MIISLVTTVVVRPLGPYIPVDMVMAVPLIFLESRLPTTATRTPLTISMALSTLQLLLAVTLISHAARAPPRCKNVSITAFPLSLFTTKVDMAVVTELTTGYFEALS
jgi:hypothetical protein